MRHLNLAATRLKDPWSVVSELSDLRTLNLNSLGLTEIPAQAARLRKLRTLRFAGNELANFPTVVMKMNALVSLDLRENNIRRVSARVAEHPSLQALELARNPLANVPAEVNAIRPYPDAEWDKASHRDSHRIFK